MKTLRYPKTYGIITEYIFDVYSLKFPYHKRRMTRQEWHDADFAGRRNWRVDKSSMKLHVKLDNGMTIVVDLFGYQGRKFFHVDVGCRVKVYARPQDHRKFVYKLVGE